MPTSKHFCSLQYWQRLRVTLLIWQFLSLWQVYTMFFWILRRKKPWSIRKQETKGKRARERQRERERERERAREIVLYSQVIKSGTCVTLNCFPVILASSFSFFLIASVSTLRYKPYYMETIYRLRSWKSLCWTYQTVQLVLIFFHIHITCDYVSENLIVWIFCASSHPRNIVIDIFG